MRAAHSREDRHIMSRRFMCRLFVSLWSRLAAGYAASAHRNVQFRFSPLPDVVRRPVFALPTLALVLFLTVHASAVKTIVMAEAANGKANGSAGSNSSLSGRAVGALPAPVAEMREYILMAVQAGQIEDLKTPIEWNELPPEIADEPVNDPITYWKEVSGDGQGREILAILGKILDMKPAHLPIGQDPENNIVYVWPYLAELPLDKLTPSQEVDLYRLVSPAEAQRMREKKTWTWYRLAIGADGTWHSFKKSD